VEQCKFNGRILKLPYAYGQVSSSMYRWHYDDFWATRTYAI
jgi:hypothetical protein